MSRPKSRDRHTSTQIKTVLKDGSSLLLAADSTRAVAQAEEEVLVQAQAANITNTAAELLSLLRAVHVIGAKLLLIESVFAWREAMNLWK